MLDPELKTEIDNAVKLHGHLGPFLVIGVRMGRTAREKLQSKHGEHTELHATVTVPLVTPFSCVIDGIQTATSCTVGNQRLKTENSRKHIAATFTSQNHTKTFNIQVVPKTVENIMQRLSEGEKTDEVALEVASMPEETLFTQEEKQISPGRNSRSQS